MRVLGWGTGAEQGRHSSLGRPGRTHREPLSAQAGGMVPIRWAGVQRRVYVFLAV